MKSIVAFHNFVNMPINNVKTASELAWKSVQTITVNYCGNQHHCLIVSIQCTEEIIYVR